MMVENLVMSSQAKDVFCIWLVSPLLRKSLIYINASLYIVGTLYTLFKHMLCTCRMRTKDVGYDT